MKKEDLKQFSKYFLLVLMAVLIFVSFKIVQPFLVSIISAFILAFFSKPLYDWLNKRMRPHLAAFLCVILVILVILIPLGALLGGVSSQAVQVAQKLDDVPALLEKVNSWAIFQNLDLKVGEFLQDSSFYISSLFNSAISFLPKLLIAFILLIFGMYYFLTNWESITKHLKKYIPLKNRQEVSNEISKSTTEIVHGFFIIGIIEFAIAVLGFYAFGVGPYLLFAVLIFFLAFIPGAGSAIVWIPMAIYYLIAGSILTFVGVLVTGVILSVAIELVVRAKFIGSKTNINPFVMLLGILGGIFLFGVVGFIIGPLILTYAIKVLNFMAKEVARYH